MARDRRTCRVLLVAVAIIGSSLSTGCLRSPLLRPADNPVPRPAPLQESSPDNPLGAPPGPTAQDIANTGDKATAAQSGPGTTPPAAALELRAAPAALPAQALELPAKVPQPQPGAPLAAPEPDTRTTPLLDAAFERVSAIRQDERDAPEPAPAVAKPAQASPPPVVPQLPVNKPQPAPHVIVIEPGPPAAPALIEPEDLLPRPASPPGPHEADPPREKPETPPPAPPAPSEGRSSASPADEPAPLGIAKLRLCRKVHGFGSFDPLVESEVKAGQRIIVYCEMTGMRYEAKGASFVSRLTSKIEISSALDGAVLWSCAVGPAEDLCASRRHDFYVNYRVDLPTALAPGSYRLRLMQTDLVANQTTSAELPFDIVP